MERRHGRNDDERGMEGYRPIQAGGVTIAFKRTIVTEPEGGKEADHD